MAREDDVCGMTGKCVKNRVNSIYVLFIQVLELIAAVKKGNSVKSDERSNGILVDGLGYVLQVHIMDYECFEKRGIYRRERVKNSRIFGDSEGFEVGHL